MSELEGMSERHTPDRRMPVEKTVDALLQKHDGVFLGEVHGYSIDHPNGKKYEQQGSVAMMKLAYDMLPTFKERGVNTLSIELPQSVIDDIAATKTPQELLEKYPAMKNDDLTMHWRAVLIQGAEKQGMKVLGHEHAALEAPVQGFLKHGSADPDVMRNALSAKGMRQRNEYAANYINEHKAEGKVVVIGGTEHSGAMQGGGSDTLNNRLGIPSVDFIERKNGARQGEVYKPLDKGADYNVRFDAKVKYPAAYEKKPNEAAAKREVSELIKQGMMNWVNTPVSAETPPPAPIQAKGKTLPER